MQGAGRQEIKEGWQAWVGRRTALKDICVSCSARRVDHTEGSEGPSTGGARAARLVKHPILGFESGHDLRVLGSSPKWADLLLLLLPLLVQACTLSLAVK